MNGANLQIFGLNYEKLQQLISNINSKKDINYNYQEVSSQSNNKSFKGNITWQKLAKDPSKQSEEIIIARVFQANDNVKLDFPPQNNDAAIQKQQEWIVRLLQEFSGSNNVKHLREIPIIVVNGFKPEILQKLLNKIAKINSANELKDKILLKFECTDNGENYKELKQLINTHNQQIEEIVKSIPKRNFIY